jgi:hypothetical protein
MIISDVSHSWRQLTDALDSWCTRLQCCDCSLRSDGVTCRLKHCVPRIERALVFANMSKPFSLSETSASLPNRAHITGTSQSWGESVNGKDRATLVPKHHAVAAYRRHGGKARLFSASYQMKVSDELRVPAAFRTGKCSWNPFGTESDATRRWWRRRRSRQPSRPARGQLLYRLSRPRSWCLSEWEKKVGFLCKERILHRSTGVALSMRDVQLNKCDMVSSLFSPKFKYMNNQQ